MAMVLIISVTVLIFLGANQSSPLHILIVHTTTELIYHNSVAKTRRKKNGRKERERKAKNKVRWGRGKGKSREKGTERRKTREGKTERKDRRTENEKKQGKVDTQMSHLVMLQRTNANYE